jgi:hypothetical protein
MVSDITSIAFRRWTCLVVCFVIGCAWQSVVQPQFVHAAARSDSLLLYPTATRVWSRNGAIEQLEYHVNVKFPATEVVSWVSERLQKAGWKPLDYDFLNPHISPLPGWEQFYATPKPPPVCVHQWMNNWRNPSGEVVRYVFRYEQPCGASSLNDTSVLRDLLVVGTFYPRSILPQLQKIIEQHSQTSTPN